MRGGGKLTGWLGLWVIFLALANPYVGLHNKAFAQPDSGIGNCFSVEPEWLRPLFTEQVLPFDLAGNFEVQPYTFRAEQVHRSPIQRFRGDRSECAGSSGDIWQPQFKRVFSYCPRWIADLVVVLSN